MKKKILYLFMVLCLIPRMVLADVTNDNYITSGDDYQVTDNYNNTHLTFGDNIEILNRVDGIYGIFGDTVKYNTTNDYVAIFGNNVTVNGSIKDGAIFGNNVMIENVNIKRDIVIFGNNVTIRGNFDGNVVVYGRTVNITNSVFNKNLTIDGSSITIDEDTSIKLKLIYEEDNNVNIATNNIGEVVINKANKNNDTTKSIGDYIYSLIRLLVIFLVIYLIIPKFLDKFSNNVGKNFGYGALTFFLLPIILLILMFTSLASTTAIIGIMLYAIIIMLAKVICGYVIGKWIWKKFVNKQERPYLIGLLGITLLYLFTLIAYIGAFITLGCLIYSFGIFTNMIIDMRK